MQYYSNNNAADVRLVFDYYNKYIVLIYPAMRLAFDEPDTENAVVIRLSDGNILERYRPATSNFLATFDTTGSIEKRLEPYYSDGTNLPRYTITYSASYRDTDSCFSISFTLLTDDNVISMNGR